MITAQASEISCLNNIPLSQRSVADSGYEQCVLNVAATQRVHQNKGPNKSPTMAFLLLHLPPRVTFTLKGSILTLRCFRRPLRKPRHKNGPTFNHPAAEPHVTPHVVFDACVLAASCHHDGKSGS